MRWMQSMLASLIGRVKVVVEFDGISEECLERTVHDAAVERLKQIEMIAYNEEQSDKEKLEEICSSVLEE